MRHEVRDRSWLLNHAVDWEYIRQNPAKKIKDPKIPRREMDFLAPQEAREFLAAAPPKWYPFFLTAITTGLRLGELLAMKWGNLDWNSGRYFVKETLSRKRGVTLQVVSAARRRTVPVSP